LKKKKKLNLGLGWSVDVIPNNGVAWELIIGGLNSSSRDRGLIHMHHEFIIVDMGSIQEEELMLIYQYIRKKGWLKALMSHIKTPS
jgi:hypothetical protein